MPRIAVVNVGAHGHINPTLAVCQGLVEEGAEVVYFAPEAFREVIEKTGARFELSPSLMTAPGATPPGSHPLALLAGKLAAEFSQTYPTLKAQLKALQPDLIIYDRFALAAGVIAAELGCRAAHFCPSYAMNEQFGPEALFRAAAAAGGAPPSEMPRVQLEAEGRRYRELSVFEVFSGQEGLNIVFMPRAFQPAGESFDSSFVFVGPCLMARTTRDCAAIPENFLKERPLLLISLGTVFNQWPAFFDMCIEAFSSSEWNVLIASGQQVAISELRKTPPSIKIFPHIPQLEVLPHTLGFISHGGMNSTMEALSYGVPLLVVPQMPEQAMTARRLEELGLGRWLPREQVTPKSLREGCERVIGDAALRRNLQDMQLILRSCGGVPAATQAILEYARASESMRGTEFLKTSQASPTKIEQI